MKWEGYPNQQTGKFHDRNERKIRKKGYLTLPEKNNSSTTEFNNSEISKISDDNFKIYSYKWSRTSRMMQSSRCTQNRTLKGELATHKKD